MINLVGILTFVLGLGVFAFSEYRIKKSKSDSGIIGHIVFIIASAAVAVCFLCSRALFNDGSRAFAVKLTVTGMIFLLIQIVRLLFCYKNTNLGEIYFITAFTLGVIYSLIYPIGAVPDENSHIGRVYEISDNLMGLKAKEEGQFLMRKTDEGRIRGVVCITQDELNYYWDSFKESGNENGHVSYLPELYVATPGYQYIPQVLGMTLGRLCGIGFTGICYLARLAGLLAFVAVVSLAISEIPVAKGLLFSVMLLPMTLQQAMGISYDVFVISSITLEIALTLRLLKEDDYRNKKNIARIVVMVIFALLIFGAKSHAYLAISLFPFMVLFKKLGIDYKKIGKIALVLLGIGLLGYFALVILAQHGVQIIKEYENINEALSPTASMYTVGYLINHPNEIPVLIANTLKNNGTFVWLNSLIGYSYGWYQNSLNDAIGIGFILVVLLATIRRDDEKIDYRAGEKVFMFVAFILSVLFIYAGMLLNSSLIIWHFIAGVQGRYILPVIFIPLYLIGNKVIVSKKDQTEVVVLSSMFLQLFTVLSMLSVE